MTIKNYERKIKKLDSYYKHLDESNEKYLKKISNLEKLVRRHESKSKERSARKTNS
jgi:predicted RNase H-like nuclease (RuvC/YqgF family)